MLSDSCLLQKAFNVEALVQSLSRLTASPLDFALVSASGVLVLQREPARRLEE